MSDKCIFKVWDVTRTKKSFFMIKERENLCLNLILAASRKFNIDGSQLLLEKDGTEINDDEILMMMHEEILLVLQKNEFWIPSEYISNRSDVSLGTTITYISDSGTPSIQQLPELNETSPSSSTTPISTPILVGQLTDDDSNGVTNPTSFSAEDSDNASDTLTDAMSRTGTLITTGTHSDTEYVGEQSCNNANSDFKWAEYTIPWNKISEYDKKQCCLGTRSKQSITAIVHTVISDLREIKKDIPSRAFKLVAKKMIDKYPKMFRDYDEDGVVLGDGSHSLFSKLYERNNYLNRPHKRKTLLDRPQINPKNVKNYVNNRAGCSNWHPDLQDGEDDENVTYALQRAFLNAFEPPSIEEITVKFPTLLEASEILKHFKKLTSVDVEDVISLIKEKCPKVIQFGTQQKLNSDEDTDVARCLHILALYFKEDFYSFFYKINDFAEIDQEKFVSLCLIKNESEEEIKYFPVMEKRRITEGYDDFLGAFIATFCLYFNFNLVYKKSVQIMLEMVQRYFFKIHPDSGGKSKKLSVTKRKVITLIKKLSC